MKLLTLTVLLTLTSFARAEEDTATEAKAAVCETCTGSQANNDPLTMDPRQKRRDQAAALTNDGSQKKTDEQGTGTGH